MPSSTDASIDQLAVRIDQARALHGQGQHQAAAAIYEEILQAHPGNAEAHYRYGNVLKDQGAWPAALDNYDRAVALKPDYVHALCNRAVVLGLMNRIPDALASYERALALDPTDVIALCNQGILLKGLGKTDAALASFDKAIARDGACYQALFSRAALLQQERREWRAALAAYDRAIDVNSADALAHYNRGSVLRELGQWNAALTSFGQAVALNTDFSQAYAARAEMLQKLNQLAPALESYDESLALNPSDATTHNNRAVLLQKMRRFDAALAGYDQALTLDSGYAEAHFNRGTVLTDLDQADAALESYDRAIAMRPNFGDAHVNRGFVLQDKGLIHEAIASYRHSLSIDSELAEAHYNLALASLAIGDYETGWREYEWRWRATSGPIFRERREFQQPLWIGCESLAGKTILLYGEQGLGDSLQFCRYASLVAALGARVILEVPAPLVNCCSMLSGVAEVISYGSPLPAFDYQCPLMSLPLAFKTTLGSIPAADGYLLGDFQKVAAWQERLGAKTKPRIGLTWSGNQAAGPYRKRHFALAGLLPYLPADFEYHCVQTEVAAADAETLARGSVVFQWADALRDFSDTAALCQCLDRVITVDTSVAHLSAALGKPTWVLLAFSADWRWLTNRDDSPWYRTARLFRQSAPGDWDGVFERVGAELRRMTA